MTHGVGPHLLGNPPEPWKHFHPLGWMCVCVCVQLCPALCDPMGCKPSKLLLSVEFSRQEYWNDLPFPTPGNLPDPGIEPVSLASPVLAGRFFNPSLGGSCQSHSHIEKGAVSYWPSL